MIQNRRYRQSYNQVSLWNKVCQLLSCCRQPCMCSVVAIMITGNWLAKAIFTLLRVNMALANQLAIFDMNTSQTDRQEGTDPLNKEAYAVFIFITVANVITCPFTTLLNVLIIISVKTKVFLRTKSNIALACLAVTDSVMGLIGQPVFISLVITRLQGEDTLNLKQAVVNAFIFNFRLLTTLSLFHLALINVER